MNNTFYKNYGKRIFDLILLIPAALIGIPLIAGLSLLIYVKLGKPVFFKQLRPGLNGKPFVIYKFRTMLDTRDETGALLPNEQRLTPFGMRLRRTSFDELPELFNILRGDMSFVGPRPLLMQYLDRYTDEQKRRHDVKPGMTGWAQINGRNAITWEEKFQHDVWYVENYSLVLDIKILLITFFKVLKREGVSPKEREIMTEFEGSENDETIRTK